MPPTVAGYNPKMPSDPATPLTSLVIPCFNHGAWVAEAARSCLDQRDAKAEVIVVNDGSDDGTTPAACDALEPLGVRVIHQPNAGLPAARNAGARIATGDYLAFLDADDWIEPSFLRVLHTKLAADPDASHAYCQERLTDLGKGVIWRVPEWDSILLLVTNLHPVTCLIRRDRFEAAEGFDESMNDGYEDWDLWLKFAAHGWHGVRVREPLFNWRRHSQQTMIDDATARHEALYRRLLANHQDFFAKHAAEVAVRANTILRQAECHWIDETHTPIELQYLHAVRDAYHNSDDVAIARRLGPMLSRLPRPVRAALRKFSGDAKPDLVTHPATEPERTKKGRPTESNGP
ncbi:MAG: glycosyltransferase family 2 protein [Phycisphaerales bacterium]|nr:glycosyltransferase family 2 protein [Phycisphaerales bacterium]